MKKQWLYYGAILMACMLAGGCADDFYLFEPIESSAPMVLVINHRQDSTSQEISQHVTQTMDYAGIPYQVMDVSRIERISIPTSIRLVYLTTDYVKGFADEEIERLVRFAAAGNEVVVLNPIFDKRFSYLLGIKKDAGHIINDQADGFHFNKDMFPDYKDVTVKNRQPYLHYGFDGSQFVDEAAVVVSAATDSTYPVVLQRDIGYGRSIYFNTTVMRDKDYRGLLFSVGLKALAGIPYRVANTSTIFLDDFPAPLYNEKMPPIDKEYNLSHEDFVTQIWWPDMKALADTFNIDYTTVLAFNYNAVVVPPFDFNEWKASIIKRNGQYYQGSIWLAQDVRDTRHELGFHGYNHFSLWKDEWPNQTYMEMAIEAAKKRWIIDQLGEMPVTYIPPTNLVDSVGLASINRKMPSIKYMSSLYLGHVADGGGREFGPDPLLPQLFDYPRITSGYINDQIDNLTQNSLFIYTGIWTHFLHPDDVFQGNEKSEHKYRSRNPLGLGWHSDEDHDYGLYEVFKQRLEETLLRYPKTRFLAAREAAPIVRNWIRGKSYYSVRPDDIVAMHQHKRPSNRGQADKFWFMYAPASDKSTVERALADIDEDYTSSPLWEGRLYQFSTSADSVLVPNLHKPLIHKQEMIAEVMKSYHTTIAEERNPEASQTLKRVSNIVPQWQDKRFQRVLNRLKKDTSSQKLENRAIKLAVEFDSLQVAISILEDRLLQRKEKELPDMKKLSRFYGWNEAPDRAFWFADTLWQKYGDESALAFNDQITSLFGAPGIQYQRRWTRRALQLNPRDDQLLQKLVRLNEGAERWAQQKKYLAELLALHPQADSLYAYAIRQGLAYQDDQQTLEWLKRMPEGTRSRLQSLWDEIAYLYADHSDYTRAGMWAEGTRAVPPQTKLYWLLKQQRYHDFIEKGTLYLQENPTNDSLRGYVGRQLVYENFRGRGFQFLYPLFERNRADSLTKKLVRNEISYMGYERRKRFYRRYPDFFSEKSANKLKRQYRQTEGTRAGIQSSFAYDNFNNDVGRVEAYTNWGNEHTFRHRVAVGQVKVRSLTQRLTDSRQNLLQLTYSYRRKFWQQAGLFTFVMGTYLNNQQIYPTANAAAWIAGDSTFTSANLRYSPIFTVPALYQHISRIKATLYREDYWIGNFVQTNFSLTGRWFTDKNIAYESGITVYSRWPFPKQHIVRPVAGLSYADAYKSQPNGIPYYTADHLITGGVGLQVQYQDAQHGPGFSAKAEFLAKRDNRNGNFWTGFLNIKAQIADYWQLKAEGYLSTSKIYRYNSINVGIYYIFPRKLLP